MTTSAAIQHEVLALRQAGRSYRAIQKLLAMRGEPEVPSRGTIANICRRVGGGAEDVDIRVGDCRQLLPLLAAGSVQCCVTSPPYWGVRDYRHAGQLGREDGPADYVAELVAVCREIRRVLAATGTLWLVLGDSYNNRARVRGSAHQPSLNGFAEHATWAEQAAAGGVRMTTREGGLKEKDLIGIPWRVALALQADGWFLRSAIAWTKPCGVPQPVRDRPGVAYEHVFLLSKSGRYYYDAAACTERNVWSIAPSQSALGHPAAMPVELAERCIRLGTQPGDLVLDPFAGAGTTGVAAKRLGRRALLVELHKDFAELARQRLAED